MAYFKGFGHGLAAGMVLGVLIAPRPGRETRHLISATCRRARTTTERAVDTAQRSWQVAQPAVQLARQTAVRMTQAAQPVARAAGGRLADLAGRSGTLPDSQPFFAPEADPSVERN
ncbi:MAG: YtxH domain-containing protein [Candidatus Dormibacteria bacterium]